MSKTETKTKAGSRPVDALVMPLWKKYPYLFANGKFYVKSGTGFIEQILGTELNQHDDGTWHYHIEGDTTMFPVEDAEALIARPISDMSDDETELFSEEIGSDDLLTFKSDTWKRPAYNALLYLLSIGVYPFNQKHFEQGEVIEKEA